MASLRSYLPPAGGTVWRNERRLTRSSSTDDGDAGLSRTKIKHIVVREVWKRDLPSPHAFYKIDVMTQSNHWFILRRYREFDSLHRNLVKQYNIPSDMLPRKKFLSNMSLAHLENRRNALEHYLQRLINSHHNIAESQELFHFLNVQTHDVLCVTRQLAKVLEKEGRNVLASGGVFTFSPTQMYCITRQLQLPHIAIEQSDTSNPGEEIVDLGHLYGFIQELRSLCVSGVASRFSPCQELISNQAFDISLFKSLQKLQIDKCHIFVIDGLFRIQKQLTHVTLKNCLKHMKEFLVDAALQKRAVKQAGSSVESWRNMSTTRLTDNRVVVRPWVLLTHINMSHNKISSFDHSLKLLPSLEQLDLSHNEFVYLDLEQLTSSTLTFLNLSHNRIHYVSATARDLRNLKSLLLTNNKLRNLDGVECLRGLVELDVRQNEIKGIEELAKVSPLLHLRILAITGNPCVASKSYRIQVFTQLKARELILDGIKITESEKAKVHLQQGRKAALPSADLRQSPKPSGSGISPVVQKQGNQDMKKKVTSYRDDDQDSGFGGNYTGSVDEGGLVFDWSCYSNTMDMACGADSLLYHVAGPSTSRNGRTFLSSPTSGLNSSSDQLDQGNVRLVSECNVSSGHSLPSDSRLSDNATHRLKDASISPDGSDLALKGSIRNAAVSPLTANDLTSDLSDITPSTESKFLESTNYRGKLPASKAKRTTKAPISSPSTLLQLSLNEAVSKRDESGQQAEAVESHVVSPNDHTHSILNKKYVTSDRERKEMSFTPEKRDHYENDSSLKGSFARSEEIHVPTSTEDSQESHNPEQDVVGGESSSLEVNDVFCTNEVLTSKPEASTHEQCVTPDTGCKEIHVSPAAEKSDDPGLAADTENPFHGLSNAHYTNEDSTADNHGKSEASSHEQCVTPDNECEEISSTKKRSDYTERALNSDVPCTKEDSVNLRSNTV